MEIFRSSRVEQKILKSVSFGHTEKLKLLAIFYILLEDGG